MGNLVGYAHLISAMELKAIGVKKPDATESVAFTVEMAKRALVIVLREETEYLQRYDTLLEVVNDNYDVRGSLLNKLKWGRIKGLAQVIQRVYPRGGFRLPRRSRPGPSCRSPRGDRRPIV